MLPLILMAIAAECSPYVAFARDVAHIFEQAAHYLHACELHRALHCSFGAYLVRHAALLRRGGKNDAARETSAHGLVYCMLGLS